MAISIKANSSDIVQYQLPEHHRDKAQFIKFLQYYYKWMEENNRSTSIIQNLVEDNDIDNADDATLTLIVEQIFGIIPRNTIADKRIIAKHLKDFLRAKGSLPSYEFIMTALFGEDMKMSWMSDHVLKASANKLTQVAKVCVEVDETTDFMNCIGARLTQDVPKATATIEDVKLAATNGKIFNIITVDSKTINGTFQLDKPVRALHRSVDSTKTEVKDYYKKIDWNPSTKTLVVQTESFKNIRYNSLLIKQIGSDFSGTIGALISTSQVNNSMVLMLTEFTGTIGSGEFFVIPRVLDGKFYTRDDYEYGVISESVVGVDMHERGSLIKTGWDVGFIGGSGSGTSGAVSSVGRGVVDEAIVVSTGEGYSVGDKLIVSDVNAGGYGFAANVASVDGIGADVTPIMELDSVYVVSAGSNYEPGETFEIMHPSLTNCSFSVSTVAQTTLALDNVRIDAVGADYRYAKVALSLDGGAPVAGLSAAVVLNDGSQVTSETTYALYDTTKRFDSRPFGSVVDIRLIDKPSGLSSSGTYAFHLNGYGATVSATVAGGGITGTTSLVGGYNYIDPVVVVSGDGTGAVLSVTKDTSGTITGVVVEQGGTGYTAATLTITERYGAGAIISPVIYTDSSKGRVSTVTIDNRGEFSSLPSTFSASQTDNTVYKNTSQKTKNQILNYTTIDPVNPGQGAEFGLTFRVKRLELKSRGKFFKAPTAIQFIGGRGEGFIGEKQLVGGVLTGIVVIDPGKEYPEDSAITFSGTGVMPTATLTIIEGKVTKVNITGGGSGLTDDLDWVVASPSTATATGTASISGNGEVRSVRVSSTGSGYFAVEEYTPLTLSVTGHPSVRLKPVLDDSGNLVTAEIVDSVSSNLTSEDAVVVVTGGILNGGAAKTATVTAKMYLGSCVSVDVTTSDAGFKYGTVADVFGTGSGADVKPIVNTGVDKVNMLYAGDVGAYPENMTYQLTVTDASSINTPAQPHVAAIITVKTNNFGQVGEVSVFRSGKGHVSPVLPNIPDLVGDKTGATIYLYATRGVSGCDIVDGGSNYEYASVQFSGDGTGAIGSPVLDTLGSVDSITLTATGSKYSSIPSVAVVDQSGFGAISSIRITNNGQQYTDLPVVILPTGGSREGGRVALYSSSIGKVLGVEMTDFGYGWYEPPIPRMPFSAVMSNTSGFNFGERVISDVKSTKMISDFVDSVSSDGSNIITVHLKTQTTTATIDQSVQTSHDLRIKNDDFVRIDSTGNSWDGYWKIVTVTDTTFTAMTEDAIPADVSLAYTELSVDSAADTPHANIISYDSSRNLMAFSDATESIVLTTELGLVLTTESGAHLASEDSNRFSHGKITGASSGATAAILKFNRPHGSSKIGALGKTGKHSSNLVGLLSDSRVRLNDNDKYMDHAYVISTGMSLVDYESYLKRSVHPAGYRMLGEVMIDERAAVPSLALPAFDSLSGNVIILIFTLNPVSFNDSTKKYNNTVRYFESIFDWEETSIGDLNAAFGVESLEIQDFDWGSYGDITKRIPFVRDAYIMPLDYIDATYSKDADAITITDVAHGLVVDDWIEIEDSRYQVASTTVDTFTFSHTSTSIANGTSGSISYAKATDKVVKYDTPRDHKLILSTVDYSTSGNVITISAIEPDSNPEFVDFLVGDEVFVEYVTGNIGNVLETGPLKITSIDNGTFEFTAGIASAVTYTGKLNIIIPDTRWSGIQYQS